VAALGGPSNFFVIVACITRLRPVVRDDRYVDESALRAAGAHGVMRRGRVVQVVLGPEADAVVVEMSDLL